MERKSGQAGRKAVTGSKLAKLAGRRGLATERAIGKGIRALGNPNCAPLVDDRAGKKYMERLDQSIRKTLRSALRRKVTRISRAYDASAEKLEEILFSRGDLISRLDTERLLVADWTSVIRANHAMIAIAATLEAAEWPFDNVHLVGLMQDKDDPPTPWVRHQTPHVLARKNVLRLQHEHEEHAALAERKIAELSERAELDGLAPRSGPRGYDQRPVFRAIAMRLYEYLLRSLYASRERRGRDHHADQYNIEQLEDLVRGSAKKVRKDAVELVNAAFPGLCHLTEGALKASREFADRR